MTYTSENREKLIEIGQELEVNDCESTRMIVKWIVNYVYMGCALYLKYVATNKT